MTCKLNADTSDGLKIVSDTSGEIDLQTNGTTKVHMDSSGNVGIGTSSPSGSLHINTSSANILIADTDDSNGSYSRVRADASGNLILEADVGNATGSSGIRCLVDNSEATRIDSSGNFLIGKTSTDDGATAGFEHLSTGTNITSDGSRTLDLRRNTNDGTIVQFKQAATVEGTISVSGSTVSYNGGHLSRWGRLSDNSQPTILKGTVMSNLDEMVVWEVDGVEEENEQRNQLKVSDLEGDINVAGLFVKWDTEEDGYNDIDLAMTGDMIIRIAQGTTVQRGDLLMSAGDGTAKPQGDDIVKSKTIAKVTSTTVINTYDDGSYVVPCVVMAC